MGILSKPTPAAAKRHLLFLGPCPGLPEAQLQAAASAQHPVLTLLMGMAGTTGGGSCGLAGLELLHLAVLPSPATGGAAASSTRGSAFALRNAHVQLGHAASLDACFNTLAREDGELVSLVKAASTRHHTVLLLSTGMLVLCSSDPAEHAQIVQFPQQAIREFAVLDVAAGDEHFVVCTDHGGVFTWGSDNSFGQLGDGTVWKAPHTRSSNRRTGASSSSSSSSSSDAFASSSSSPPVLLDPKELPGFGMKVGAPTQPSIIAVACGANHTILLSASKTCVYAFGKGSAGQLGGSCPGGRQVELSPVPKAIRSMYGVAVDSIYASGDHSLLLTQCGTLLAFGSNQTGAAGTGRVAKSAAAPAAAIFLTEDDAPGDDDSRRPAYATVPCMTRGRTPGEDPLFYPTRILRYRAPPRATRPVSRVSTSESHTIAIVNTDDSDMIHIYSCGLRELPIAASMRRSATPLFRADAAGAIGRSSVGEKNGSFVFRRAAMSDIVPPPSSAKNGGYVVAAGMRFTALVDSSAGTLFILGNITSCTGAVLAGTGEAAQRTPAGAACVPMVTPLAVGGMHGKRRVVAACPARGGLLILVEDKA